MPTLDNILAIILGGGRGSRLYPLTKMRSKPAVPIAGKYRLIDIPISNCINSGIYHIAIMTQFNSVSLHRHINNTYQFDSFHSGWAQIWAAEQTMDSADWYQGTADAVRKQIHQIRSAHTPYVLILAGDHLYRMDYAKMAEFHWKNNADITVAMQPVPASEVSRLGVLKSDENSRIVRFAEKPKDPKLQQEMVCRDDPSRPYMGSMGVYLFRTEVMFEMLEQHDFDDFGSDVIPFAIESHKVFGYEFDDYWEDIGTIRSFYDTNLRLASPNPPFSFTTPGRPIYSHPRYLPGSTVNNSTLDSVLLAEGCCVTNATIRHSVIGLRSQIRSGSTVLDSIIMGADYYENACQDEDDSLEGIPMLGIGRGCHIEGAIIDKNARVGAGVTIHPFPRGTELDEDAWVARDGIVVIEKDAVITAGTQIGPK